MTMKTVIPAIMSVIVSLIASFAAAPPPSGPLPVAQAQARVAPARAIQLPEQVFLPEVIIVGQAPTVRPQKRPQHVKVWTCGRFYENAVGGHNQDCAWKEVR